MSFIAKPIESAFTPAGTHAAAAQGTRNADLAKQYGQFFGDAAGGFGDYLKSLSHYDLGHAIGTAMNGLNEDPQRRVERFAAGANENAQRTATAGNNALRAQGYGDGAATGATVGAFNDANRQTNAFMQQDASPEAQQARIQALMAAFGGTSQLWTQLLGALSSGVYGQPQFQVQPNPLAQILGQAAGAYTSAAAGKAGAR